VRKDRNGRSLLHHALTKLQLFLKINLGDGQFHVSSLGTESFLFVVTAVEPCGNFWILLQRLRKYSSAASAGLRVSMFKSAGKNPGFPQRRSAIGKRRFPPQLLVGRFRIDSAKLFSEHLERSREIGVVLP